MIQTIKKSKVSKIIASYLAIQLIVTTVQPSNLFALTGGPSQPEFNSFTPIGTSDMVNLASGDFNYNIPIMDVGGYPLNLSYDSGITMDQEASWVGLGWNLSVGQINRQIRGIPDDFNGDEIKYENNLKENKTIGANVQFHPAVIGVDIPNFDSAGDIESFTDSGNVGVSVGLGVEYNNYTGWSFSASQGVSFKMSDNITVGFNMSNSLTEGVSISPNVNLSSLKFGGGKFSLGGSLGTTFNSRQGLTSLTISPSLNSPFSQVVIKNKHLENGTSISTGFGGNSGTKSLMPISYTPTKRNSLVNTSVAANAALGFEVFGAEGQGEMYVYASKQKLNSNEKTSLEKAYGFNFTENATKNDILDFNRENDRAFDKNTNALPVTNYTYDLYSINGQGISGMYQPHRSQVGYVFDRFVKDESRDTNLGVEVGGGGLVHVAVELKYSPSDSHTGLWTNGNNARSNFSPSQSENEDYEKVFYKPIGELNVDNEINLLKEQLGGEEPIELALINSNRNKQTKAGSYIGGTVEPLSPLYPFISGKIDRNERMLRNQVIQTFNKREQNVLQENYVDNKPFISSSAKDHHNLETRITQPDGSVYVYGQAAYNTKKVETTFNASTISSYVGDCTYPNDPSCDVSQELVNAGIVNGVPNFRRGSDEYFNRVTTPGYAHSYLLTEVLSADYEDLTGDGPSEDDLGAYTKIFYNDNDEQNGDPYPYNWRVPFQSDKATANRGFNSLKLDDMANYIYGEKELFYVSRIETKTHVAVFEINSQIDERRDGFGVSDEKGGFSINSNMYYLKSISLYSKPEYKELINGNSEIKPIKIAHFEYDYSLCQGVPNNPSYNNDANFDLGGKLTLKKLYFTYRGSNMGKFTPYTFDYSDVNPKYHIKGYDMWGNYREPVGNSLSQAAEPTTAEFPYVDQANRSLADQNAEAWTLKAINLPSGGKLEMQYEADDYAFVQDKPTMQMFKIRGVGNSSIGNGMNNLLYEGSDPKKYLYVELPEEDAATFNPSNIDYQGYVNKYLSSIKLEPIFFKCMVNMKRGDNDAYDYVSGYLKIDNELLKVLLENGTPDVGAFVNNSKVHLSLPVELVHRNKAKYVSDGDSKAENPIAKASWYFGRKYMNRFVYHEEESEFDVLDIARTIVSSVGSYYALFRGPNTELKNMGCAQKFSTTKSWIRLLTPDSIKIGGGLRVSQIAMHDNWDVMTGNENNPNSQLYKMTYGQDYKYSYSDGSSSGVATFEPFGTKENPFVEPHYDDVNNDRILAPEEENYVEKPFGISFFPSPMVTYGKVTVSNLNRGTYNSGGSELEVGNNGTGLVINEFYTTKDFPTITKHTPLGDPNVLNYPSGGVSIIQSMFGANFETVKRLSLSQGFTIITNDINGKTKSQKVYKESSLVNGELPNNDVIPLSEVKYFYNVDENNHIYNEFPTINDKGEVKINTIGVDYSVINDFRTSKSTLETYGGDINLAIIPAAVIPIGLSSVRPQLAIHDNELRATSTTKVIHKTTFLVEKKAYDLGAEVSTKNIAWDAETGQVLLTKTSNEYSKDNYYNFNYPAYWYYNNMGMASKNSGIFLNLNQSANNFVFTHPDVDKYLIEGDEVIINNQNRGWVINVNDDNFSLINREGNFISQANTLKVIRSGNRNLQGASMASVTSMLNPINLLDNELFDNFDEDTYKVPGAQDFRIINASAVKYNDLWLPQCDCGLPDLIFDVHGNLVYNPQGPNTFNPYLYNIKGDWRANESYAYLTGRNNIDGDNTRNSGFFNEFLPFYKIDESATSEQIPWIIDDTKWTSASQVTKYTPYGPEIENKDALNRHSSAQYGYFNKMPVAVGSNTEYRQIAFDGFEDYDTYPTTSGTINPHFSYKIEENNIATAARDYDNAHSGRVSMRLNPDTSIGMTKNIIGSTDDPCPVAGLSGVTEIQELTGNNESTCSITYQISADCNELAYNLEFDGNDDYSYVRLFNRNGQTIGQIFNTDSSPQGWISVPQNQDLFLEIVSCEGEGNYPTTVGLKCSNESCTDYQEFILNP